MRPQVASLKLVTLVASKGLATVHDAHRIPGLRSSPEAPSFAENRFPR